MQEREAQAKRPPVKSLVLLGNTYRNLGKLAQSRETLEAALERSPDSPFALYGLGKTQLSQGDYPAAIQSIEEALANGAPSSVRFDLAHAHHRHGDTAQTLQTLDALPQLDEPYRQLFATYLRQRLAGGSAPPADEIAEGLPFWEAEVERFAHTPYGQALRADVEALRHLL